MDCERQHAWDEMRPAEDDALVLALRILAPGEDDNVTLGELRREYGIATRPIPPGGSNTDA